MTAPTTLFDRFAGARIAIVGDVMLDHFLIGRADRISPEAPVPVVRLEREEFRLGGAANVAANVESLSGVSQLIGVIGIDHAGEQVYAAMRELGMDAQWLVEDASRPTTEKLRTVTGRHQQVGRVDRESCAPIDGKPLTQLRAHIDALTANGAIILSDYAKGVATPDVIAACVAAARRLRCPLLVDPKLPDASLYAGATVITPNHHEAELMTGRRIENHDDARAAARRIHEVSGASVLMTWGERGMWVMDTSGTSVEEVAIAATAREVADVTGAGDTVIATLAMSLCVGGTLAEAAQLATVAASVAVARFGPAAVSIADARAALSLRASSSERH